MKKLFLTALVIVTSMGRQSFASGQVFVPEISVENRIGAIEKAIVAMAAIAAKYESPAKRTGLWGYWDMATSLDSEVTKAIHLFTTIVTVYTIMTKISSMYVQDEQQQAQREYQPVTERQTALAPQGRVQRPAAV